MGEPFSSYPPIDPDHFDLIVVGTSLPASVLAAAATAAGKTVLHLDPNHFYGSHCASLSIPDLTSFLNHHSASHRDGDRSADDLAPRSVYSDVEISSFAPEVLAEHSRRFSVDAAGPRVLFCAEEAIDLVVRSGTGNYLEFKSVEASFVCDEDGRLWSVPDSRAAIFKDRTLGLMEKNQLMRFFKLVQQHLEAEAAAASSSDDHDGSRNPRISDEDLESPFVDFLTKMRLPPKIKSIILYAIAMADYDQSAGANVLKTKDGVERLALYNKSVGRFPNSSGAMIYPIYGNGELPQAFCRLAAVKGCIHVLRMPVISLLKDEESGKYKGARLASGQDVFSEKLVLDPTLMVTAPPKPIGETQGLSLGDIEGKVARGICVLSRSLKQDVSNFLVVYPPRSLYPEQKTSVRAVQISGGLAVCPPGMCILYFSALCDDAKQGKSLLRVAMNALLKIPEYENPETNSESQNESEVKPSLLWSATFIQELTTSRFGHISHTPMPDGNLNYNDLLDSTIKLFQNIYPDSEFFPESNTPDNVEDEGEVSPES